MRSFRTELENPVVEKDIIKLEKEIRLFREGKLDGEKFRSLRLARGVYGQRQQGVQMIRIKLPYGKMTVNQLLKIADISDEYATRNLHLTTRQDIQIHYVSLDRTPELWARLEQDNITLREACGNTVRNITASSIAGIDSDEPFDVSPYAQAMFEYFLRNPICQDMGRKFKIAFSSSDKDSALTYMHDLGFIPKIKNNDTGEIRGFKVMVGGGLGAIPVLAKTVHEFLHEDLIIPFAEAVLRVFDRCGERSNRSKARLKFLINKIGFEEFMCLLKEEQNALKSKEFKINHQAFLAPLLPKTSDFSRVEIEDDAKYQKWLATNIFEQKQTGYFGVYIKILTGDFKTSKARSFAEIAKKYAADDIRITVNQGLLLKFVEKNALPNIFTELNSIGLAEPGFDSTTDVTSCPGTDTCNLGISSSTGITIELERMLKSEFPDLIHNSDIKIKISGCMNACGQHDIANIGFHGSTIKVGVNVLPALQVLLGGGGLGNGSGRMAEKIIKIPSKRTPALVRLLLKDYETNSTDGEYFNDYYDRNGKEYFYFLLKPFKDLTNIQDDEFVDWGHEVKFEPAIGVGECAGVMIDLVATLLYEAEEKLEWAKETLTAAKFADSIYHSYNGFVTTAKALLLDKQVTCNTQHGIINDFDKHYVAAGLFSFTPDFKTHVLQINQMKPSKEFAEKYLTEVENFFQASKSYRENQLKST
jgi:sulfite reductase (ferredoxin)